MKHILVLAVFFPILLLAGGILQPASSQIDCAVESDYSFYLLNFDVVFIGTATKSTTWDADKEWQNIQFEIEYHVKGIDNDQYTIDIITSENNDGFQFHIGSKYLVHAGKAYDVDLFTGMCSNNKMLSTEDEVENQLSKIRDIRSNMSPLKQLKSGTPADKIQCRESLIQVEKHDGSPACVEKSSVSKFIERGWKLSKQFDSDPYKNAVESKHTFLSKSAIEWKNMSQETVFEFYEKYEENDFYTELGKFLIKEEIKKEMEQQQIRNIHEDFAVYPGMMLTSLPPRIGFSAVINATDQKTYFAEGGTFTNTIGDMGVSLRELVFYPDILNPSIMTLSDHVSQRQMPFEKLLNLDPKITVSKGSIYDVDDNYSVNAQPYELILNLDQNDTVSFYNNFDFPVRIQAEIKDYDNNNSKESDSQSNLETGTIASQKTGTIQFDKIGQYEWHAMVHPMSQDDPDGTWTKIRGEGQITSVTKD